MWDACVDASCCCATQVGDNLGYSVVAHYLRWGGTISTLKFLERCFSQRCGDGRGEGEPKRKVESGEGWPVEIGFPPSAFGFPLSAIVGVANFVGLTRYFVFTERREGR